MAVIDGEIIDAWLIILAGGGREDDSISHPSDGSTSAYFIADFVGNKSFHRTF